MSIEQALADNTAAIRDLIATLAKGVPATQAQVAAVVSEAKADPIPGPAAIAQVQEAPAPAPEPVAQAASTQATAPAAAAPERKAAPSAPTYEDVKAAIVKMAQAKGRAETAALLGKFGATKGPDLKPEQYADFLAAAAV